jgi:hypothetical protein
VPPGHLRLIAAVASSLDRRWAGVLIAAPVHGDTAGR